MRDFDTRPPRLRRLSDDEIQLWLTVAATVHRRPGSVLPPPPAIRPSIIPVPPPPSPLREVPQQVLPLVKPALAPLAPLERKLKQKLSRGRATADAAIDLHGFYQDEAHAALLHFLERQQRLGSKVVLVVTGKGGRSLDQRFHDGESATGVLRRKVPLWLALPQFRTLVLGWEEAGRPHGGAGALYVRLRRGTHARSHFED